VHAIYQRAGRRETTQLMNSAPRAPSTLLAVAGEAPVPACGLADAVFGAAYIFRVFRGGWQVP